MNKEFFKSVSLCSLIIVALVLTSNIWYSKELWSNDYSSFMYSIKNIFNKNNMNFSDNTDEIIYKSQFSENFIALTKNSIRSISYAGTANFPSLSSALDSIIGSTKKDGAIVEIKPEDMLNAHKTNSIMASFPINISLVSYFKTNDNFFDSLKAPTARSIIITLDNSQSAINYLYFSDMLTKKSYRMPIKYTENKNIEKFNQLMASKSISTFYAFELHHDEKKEGLDRILFDKFVPFEFTTNSLFKVEATPILYKSQLKNPYDSVFKAFNITKNSARTYTDKNNVINFIENNLSLKIYKDGYFEVEANKNYDGLPLNGINDTDAVIKLVNMLYKSIATDSTAFLRIASIVATKDITTYNFIYETKNGSLYIKNRSAVSVIVRNKKIISYKQQVLSVKLTTTTQNSTNLVKAYDQMYKTDIAREKKNLTIRSMLPTNIYVNNTTQIGWICEFSDGTVETIIE